MYNRKINSIKTRIGTLTKMSNQRKRIIRALLAMLLTGSYKTATGLVGHVLFNHGFKLSPKVPIARGQIRAELYELSLLQCQTKTRIKMLQAEVQLLISATQKVVCE